MNIITIDFETYFSQDYGFAKHTTEEYVRDDRFEVVGVAVKVGDGETQWFSGTFEETQTFLYGFHWGEALVLAHNTLFDGAIMSWKFGIKPMGWFDTLSMARAIDNEPEATDDAGNKGDAFLSVDEMLLAASKILSARLA